MADGTGAVRPEALAAVLQTPAVRIEPLGPQHMEALRAACAEDREIWTIYPVNLLGEDFDKTMERHGRLNWVRFAVFERASEQLVGMSAFIEPNEDGVVEIGASFITPSLRGTGFNRALKTLMIDHAFACGYRRIEFRVDTRNARSMAAVMKLGAVHEGTLRRNRTTWTGYVRDTAIFGLLRDDWTG